MAVFGDYRHRRVRGRVVGEIDVDVVDCGWDSDSDDGEEGQEHEVQDNADTGGILNNTIFNLCN